MQAHAGDHALAADSGATSITSSGFKIVPKNLIIRLSNAKNDTKPGQAWSHWSTVVTKPRAGHVCARRRSRATTAATVAHAGQKDVYEVQYNTLNDLIHTEWCRANGFFKELGHRKPSHKLRAQASSPSLQAQGSWEPESDKRTSCCPGYKQPGQKYFFYA